MRNLILILLLALSAEICYAQDTLTTIILVRHAEKGFDEDGDPSLTEEGKERALELSRILKEEKIDGIFTTPFKRTRETIEPLASIKNIEIIEYNPFKMDEIMNIIGEKKGQKLVPFVIILL